jgi:Mg2+/Co2+ transporter CorB
MGKQYMEQVSIIDGMTMWGLIGVELVCLLLLLVAAAFFSGAEAALTSASRARMQALETQGNKRARLVNVLRDKKEKLAGALQLGNTLVSVLVGSLATAAAIAAGLGQYILPVTFAVACLLLIFCEVMPKTLGRIYADRVALRMALPVAFFVAVFAPVTRAVEKVIDGFFYLMGVDKDSYSAEVQEEELRGAIALLGDAADEDSAEGQEKRAMLRSILDLADINVEEIMVHRKNVKMINAGLPVTRIVDEVLHSAFTRLPVWKESPDNIIGIIHVKLLLQELRNCGGDVSRVKIENAMLEPWFIPDTATLFEQLQAFRKRREHFAVMVDEYGALMGVVTLEDILEEIVGEIDDEHDTAVTGVRPQPDGTFLIDGNVTIRDLNREMDWGLPDDEYSTVAGLLLYETQRIPSVGQAFTFYGFRFDVMKKQRNQLTVVRVTPPLRAATAVGE